jgi:hypothetical protein
MTLSHARAVAFDTDGVPTGWGALLLDIEWMNEVDTAESVQRLSNDSFEPGLRNFPTFRVRMPARARPAIATEP